jgi:hypothetical protein
VSDLTDFLLSTLNGAKKPVEPEADSPAVQSSNSQVESLAALKLKPAAERSLKLAGIQTVKQFMEMSGADFLVVPGIDVFTAAELKKVQARFQVRPRATMREETHSPKGGGGGVPADTKAGQAVSDLDLPTAYIRALTRNGIRTIDALCGHTMEDLVAKFRLVAARAIARAVERQGYALAPSHPSRTDSVALGMNVSSPKETEQAIERSAGIAHPNGPGKWLNLAFATLSDAEAHLIVALHGLDGKGVRDLGKAASEIGIDPQTGFRISLMARARLRVVVPSPRLAQLPELYMEVIRERDRACTAAELAVAVGYPDSGDGYDPLAFTRFFLPLCEGLRQAGPDQWDLVGKRRDVVEAAPDVKPVSSISSLVKPDPHPTASLKTVELASIRRVEARLVVLVVALAAQASCAVNIARLREFADGAGLRLKLTDSINIELGEDGIWLDASTPGELRLISSLRLVITPNDLPGKLTDLVFLQTILPKAGVLRTAVGDKVEFPKVELAIERPKTAPKDTPETKKAPEPAYPTIRLSSIAQKETRLAVLVASLAAERGSIVNARRLQQFAEGAGIFYLSVQSISGALKHAGMEYVEPLRDHVRLVRLYRILVADSDLPGRLADLDFMRTMLPKVGVISTPEGTAPRERVELVQRQA